MLAPLLIAAVGIVASIIGTFFVNAKEGGDPQKSLNKGNIIATILAIIGIFLVARFTLAVGSVGTTLSGATVSYTRCV